MLAGGLVALTASVIVVNEFLHLPPAKSSDGLASFGIMAAYLGAPFYLFGFFLPAGVAIGAITALAERRLGNGKLLRAPKSVPPRLPPTVRTDS